MEIDGSFGEGGGQMLRVAVTLAAIMGKPIKIRNIRAKRSPPGIGHQHLIAVKAVATLVHADVKGLTIGSTELEFYPRNILGGKFLFETGTAASTSLILQSLIPVMIASKDSTLTEIRGGTNNPWAPPIDYVQKVLLPSLTKIGFKGYIELIKRGFYPKGGGIVKAFVEPTKRLSPVILTEFGEMKKIYGLSYSSRLPKHIVERMAQSANETIMKEGFKEADIKLECLPTNNRRTAISSGCGIILMAELSKGAVLGSDSLGEIGKSAEKVGQEAAKTLCRQLKAGAPVDKHLEDQLIVYMTMANGRSEIKVEEVTPHTISCIQVSKTITGANFKVSEEKGKLFSIICDGVGEKMLPPT